MDNDLLKHVKFKCEMEKNIKVGFLNKKIPQAHGFLDRTYVANIMSDLTLTPLVLATSNYYIQNSF